MSASSRMILWQLWRMTRFEILLVVLGQYVLLGLLYVAARGNSAPMFHLLMPVYFILMFIASVPSVVAMSSFAAANNPRNPMPFPLQLDYTQPVRTFTLVFLTMVYSGIKAATVYLVVAIPVRFVLGEELPLLPFAYWLAVMAAVIQAFVWTPATAGGRAWGYILGIGGVTVAFVVQLCAGQGGLDSLVEPPAHMVRLFELSAGGYFGLGLVAVGALAVATAAVERQRHGERLLPALRSRSAAPARSRSRTARRFNGPVQAQVWCEIRRALIPSLLFPLLALGLMVLLSLLTTPFANEMKQDATTMVWTLLVVVTYLSTYGFIGHLSAALRFHGGTWRYSTFEATLPVGTGTLTVIKVGTVLVGGVLATMLLAAGTAIAALPHIGEERWVAAVGDVTREVARGTLHDPTPMGFVRLFFFALWMLSAPLLIFSFGEAAAAYPRRLNQLAFVGAADVALAAALLFLRYPLRLYGTIHVWLLAAVVVAGTVWAVYRVLERRYVSRRLFIAFASVWALSVVIWCVMAARTSMPLLPTRLGLEIALLFAPLLAVLLPPLALAANRHR